MEVGRGGREYSGKQWRERERERRSDFWLGRGQERLHGVGDISVGSETQERYFKKCCSRWREQCGYRHGQGLGWGREGGLCILCVRESTNRKTGRAGRDVKRRSQEMRKD